MVETLTIAAELLDMRFSDALTYSIPLKDIRAYYVWNIVNKTALVISLSGHEYLMTDSLEKREWLVEEFKKGRRS